jgi:hypothetical protein
VIQIFRRIFECKTFIAFKCLRNVSHFTGHDITIHREFYRLPQEEMELTKVAKLLFVSEMGGLSAFRGKTLDQIEIEGS